MLASCPGDVVMSNENSGDGDRGAGCHGFLTRRDMRCKSGVALRRNQTATSNDDEVVWRQQRE